MSENNINERYTIMKDDIANDNTNDNTPGHLDETLETPLLDDNTEDTDNCFYKFLNLNLCGNFII